MKPELQVPRTLAEPGQGGAPRPARLLLAQSFQAEALVDGLPGGGWRCRLDPQDGELLAQFAPGRRLEIQWLDDAGRASGQGSGQGAVQGAVQGSVQGSVQAPAAVEIEAAYLREEGLDLRTQPCDRADADEADSGLDLRAISVDLAMAQRVPATLALRRKVLPLAEVDGEVLVACANARDTAALRAVGRALRKPVRTEEVPAESLDDLLQQVYGAARVDGAKSEPGPAEAESAGAVQASNALIQSAVLRRASDIHIDPRQGGARVRLRVDGQLEELEELSRERYVAIVSRIKVLSGLDIAERRVPQDGSYRFRLGEEAPLEIRVATIPTRYGERMTLRLLGRSGRDVLSLTQLGMSAPHLTLFEQAIARPYGLVLLVGPTGSGKTTTLFAGLSHLLKQRALNVITIEDPIEYELAGVIQVEVDQGEKVTFANALRSVLRHDPDVVLVGEIRDSETAQIALRASMTGHLVLSTLHTNTAAGAIPRLADMGVETYLIAATLRLAVAQRLVRRLCKRCRRPRPLERREAESLGRPEEEGRLVFEPQGCAYCGNRGLAGRLGVFELLPITRELSELLRQGASEGELVDAMTAAGLPRLFDDGADKLFQGHCTLRDLLTVASVW